MADLERLPGETQRAYDLRKQRVAADALRAEQRARRIANKHGVAGGRATSRNVNNGKLPDVASGLKPLPAADPGLPLRLGQRTTETNSNEKRSGDNGSTRRPGYRPPRKRS